jgi:hypothetical protein
MQAPSQLQLAPQLQFSLLDVVLQVTVPEQLHTWQLQLAFAQDLLLTVALWPFDGVFIIDSCLN